MLTICNGLLGVSSIHHAYLPCSNNKPMHPPEQFRKTVLITFAFVTLLCINIEGLKIMNPSNLSQVLSTFHDETVYFVRDFSIVTSGIIMVNQHLECPGCVDGCNIEYPSLLEGKIVLYEAPTCDETKLLRRIQRAGAIAAIGLDSRDRRYSTSYDPTGLRLPINRVCCDEVKKLTYSIFGCDSTKSCTPYQNTSITAAMSWQSNDWVMLFQSTTFLVFYTVLLVIYIIMAIFFGESFRRLRVFKRRKRLKSTSVQELVLFLRTVSNVGRVADLSMHIHSTIGNEFVPEYVRFVLFSFPYVLGLSTLMLMMLYWAEVVTSTTKTVKYNITKGRRRLYIFIIALLCNEVLAVLRGVYFFYSNGLGYSIYVAVLAFVCLYISIGFLRYGNQLLKKMGVGLSLEASSSTTHKQPVLVPPPGASGGETEADKEEEGLGTIERVKRWRRGGARVSVSFSSGDSTGAQTKKLKRLTHLVRRCATWLLISFVFQIANALNQWVYDPVHGGFYFVVGVSHLGFILTNCK